MRFGQRHCAVFGNHSQPIEDVKARSLGREITLPCALEIANCSPTTHKAWAFHPVDREKCATKKIRADSREAANPAHMKLGDSPRSCPVQPSLLADTWACRSCGEFFGFLRPQPAPSSCRSCLGTRFSAALDSIRHRQMAEVEAKFPSRLPPHAGLFLE